MTGFYEDRMKMYEEMIGKRQLTTQEQQIIKLNEQNRELSTQVKDISHLKERVENLETQIRSLRGLNE